MPPTSSWWVLETPFDPGPARLGHEVKWGDGGGVGAIGGEIVPQPPSHMFY